LATPPASSLLSPLSLHDALPIWEIPLWNPYNMAGHPFLADTQAAVFYPPRLLTIAASRFTGGFTYATLQAEALLHYWIGAVLMRSEEHTSELQSRENLVCRLLLE